MDTKTPLISLPLEPYAARYTELLPAWEAQAFDKHFKVHRIIPSDPEAKEGEPPRNEIKTGEVLDSIRRPTWALKQVVELLGILPEYQSLPGKPRVWVDDFFHPGIEAIPYSRMKAQMYTYLWAQTFDCFDFTTQFIDWMRPWEHCGFAMYSKVFVASPVLADLIDTAIPGLGERLKVVGLPFNSKLVSKLYPIASRHRDIDVVYSSRFDLEKQPHVFLQMVEDNPGLKFGICTGHDKLRGTATDSVLKAQQLASTNGSNLRIFRGLSKRDYYGVLADSKVQFNCAKQDWISFTLLEALTFGCMPLYPMFRDFPQALNYMEECLYAPGDVAHASSKLEQLLTNPPAIGSEIARILSYHDASLDRIAAEILKGEQ